MQRLSAMVDNNLPPCQVTKRKGRLMLSPNQKETVGPVDLGKVQSGRHFTAFGKSERLTWCRLHHIDLSCGQRFNG